MARKRYNSKRSARVARRSRKYSFKRRRTTRTRTIAKIARRVVKKSAGVWKMREVGIFDKAQIYNDTSAQLFNLTGSTFLPYKAFNSNTDDPNLTVVSRDKFYLKGVMIRAHVYIPTPQITAFGGCRFTVAKLKPRSANEAVTYVDMPNYEEPANTDKFDFIVDKYVNVSAATGQSKIVRFWVPINRWIKTNKDNTSIRQPAIYLFMSGYGIPFNNTTPERIDGEVTGRWFWKEDN